MYKKKESFFLRSISKIIYFKIIKKKYKNKLLIKLLKYKTKIYLKKLSFNEKCAILKNNNQL